MVVSGIAVPVPVSLSVVDKTRLGCFRGFGFRQSIGSKQEQPGKQRPSRSRAGRGTRRCTPFLRGRRECRWRGGGSLADPLPPPDKPTRPSLPPNPWPSQPRLEGGEKPPRCSRESRNARQIRIAPLLLERSSERHGGFPSRAWRQEWTNPVPALRCGTRYPRECHRDTREGFVRVAAALSKVGSSPRCREG